MRNESPKPREIEPQFRYEYAMALGGWGALVRERPGRVFGREKHQ